MFSLYDRHTRICPSAPASPSGSEVDGKSPLDAHHDSGYRSDPALASSPSGVGPATDSALRDEVASRRRSVAVMPPSPKSYVCIRFGVISPKASPVKDSTTTIPVSRLVPTSISSSSGLSMSIRTNSGSSTSMSSTSPESSSRTSAASPRSSYLSRVSSRSPRSSSASSSDSSRRSSLPSATSSASSSSSVSASSTSWSVPLLKIPAFCSAESSGVVTQDDPLSAIQQLRSIKEVSGEDWSIIIKSHEEEEEDVKDTSTSKKFHEGKMRSCNVAKHRVSNPDLVPIKSAAGKEVAVEPKRDHGSVSTCSATLVGSVDDDEKKFSYPFAEDDIALDDSEPDPTDPTDPVETKEKEKGDGFCLPWRYAWVFAMAGFGGLLFGFDTGYINGVLAMDYVENMQLAYNQRSRDWQTVTSIKPIIHLDGTPIMSRNESWVSSSGQQTGAGVAILGPISVNSLYEALNYTESDLDFDHLDHDTKEEIQAAFGWTDTAQPKWLLLDENVRPFWVCNITAHHTHKLGGHHHQAHQRAAEHVAPKHRKFHHKLRVVLSARQQQETVGGMSEKLNHNPRWFHLPAKEKLLVVGMLSIGTAMGALAGSDLADYLGRRVTLIIGTSLFLAGVADQLASEHLNSLTRGRFETGMAVGIVTVVIVVYLTEISPAHLRGHVIVMFQFSITLGLLLASCVTMTTRKLWSPAAYRIPIGLQFIWGVGLMVGLYVLPESPRWYVKVGRVNRAKIAVMRLRRVPMPGGNPKEWETDPGVEAEMKEIEEGRQHYSGDGNVTHEEAEQNFTVSRYCRSWKLCLEGPWSLTSCNAKRTLFGAALMMFQQLTGVNFVFYFGATLFKQQGFSNPFVLAAGLGAVNVVSTLVSFVIVPAARRRMLLMGGAAAMGLCQLTVGLLDVFWTLSQNNWKTGPNGSLERPHQVPSWFMATTMTAIGLYIFSYATTWGPGAWSLLGEIFPMHIRARAIGISAATNWLFNSVVCFITPLMVDQAHGNLGMWVFLIWSGSSVAAFVFVFYFVPETSGRTLEEVAFNLDFGARKIKHRHMESGTWAVEARAWNSVCESMSNENRRKSSGSGGLGSEEFVKKQGASVDSGMSGATAVSSADGPPPYRRSPQEQEKKLEDKNGHRGVPTVQVDFNMDSFSRPSSTAPQDTDDVESISPKTCRGRD